MGVNKINFANYQDCKLNSFNLQNFTDIVQYSFLERQWSYKVKKEKTMQG